MGKVIDESEEIQKLHYLVKAGAESRYGSSALNAYSLDFSRIGDHLPYEVKQRIVSELDAVEECSRTGKYDCVKYMLIAYDIVRTAREQFGAVVGPGRNSAAGSILNYCLGITDIDPLRFGLLSERFINPDFQYGRPINIDIEVDEENRDRVVKWLDEKYPYVHFDIIGFKELSKIKDVDGPVPLDDPETMAMFREARTTGIYRFDNLDMCYLLLKFLPESFSDLVLLNAVYRPDLKRLVPELLRNKFSVSRDGAVCSDNDAGRSCGSAGSSIIHYPIRDMADILDETYGVIVYQEQIMLLAQKLAGFTPLKSNQLRRALGRKDDAILECMKRDFIEGGLAREYEKDALDACWEMMFKGRYAFLKSHAVCSTYLSYKMGYSKKVS